MALLDDIFGVQETPPVDAPPPPVYESDPDVRAAMDEAWGVPPTAPPQPEAPPPPVTTPAAVADRPQLQELQQQPEVDVVSGGAAPSPENLAAYLETQQKPAEPHPFDLKAEEAANQGSPVPDDTFAKVQDLPGQKEKQLEEEYAKDPLAFVAKQAREAAEQDQRLAEVARGETEKILQDQADAAADYKTAIAKTQEHIAQLRQRADEISQKEPKGFLDDLSLGDVLGVIKGIAIGLISPVHGLASIGKTVKASHDRQQAEIESQLGNVQKQIGLLGEEAAASGDLYKARQAVDLAWKQKLPAMIAAEASKFDPNGSIAQKMFQAKQLAIADAQKAHALAEKDTFQRYVDVQKELREQQKAGIELARFRREMAPKPSGPRYTAETLNKVYPGLNLPEKPGGWSQRELDTYLSTAGKVQKLTGGNPQDASAALEAEQKQLQIDTEKRAQVVTDSDGNILGKPRAKEDANREQLRDSVASYESFRPKLTELMDYVDHLGKQYGGYGSDRWSSEEKAYYKTLRGELAEMYARVKQPTGILTDKDIERSAKPVPEVDYWTKKSNPKATYKALTGLIDHNFDVGMKTHLEGFDPEKSPTKKYKQADPAVLDAKELPPAPEVEDPNDPSMLLGILPTHGAGYGAGVSRDAPIEEKLRDSRIKEPVK